MRYQALILMILISLCGCKTVPGDFHYSGGDGTAIVSAVVICGARSESDVIQAQRHWIKQRFRGAIIQRRTLVSDPISSTDLNPCDEVEFTAADGKTRAVYFRYSSATVPVQIPAGNK